MVSVNGDGVVSAVAAGRAAVVASAGGKSSGAVRFRVTEVGDPTKRIRVLYAANTRIMVATTENDDGDTVVADDLNLGAAFSHTIITEQQVLQNGVMVWTPEGNVDVEWASSDAGILVANGEVTTDGTTGQATINLVTSDGATPPVYALGLATAAEHAVDVEIKKLGTVDLVLTATNSLPANAPVTIAAQPDE